MQNEFKMYSISTGVKNISAFPSLYVNFFEDDGVVDQNIGHKHSLSAQSIKKEYYSLY